MQQRRIKSWKYYLGFFALGLVVLGGVAIYKWIAGTYAVTDLWNALILPAIIAVFMYLSDLLVQKIADKKDRTNYEGKFLDDVAERMRSVNRFSIEDFRRLKESPRFQEALKYGFAIIKNGETERFTIGHLEKRFDARSLEGRAIPFVVESIRANLEKKQR